MESQKGGTSLCGVDLMCSQLEDPYCKLSMQQTADFLANFDDDGYFPEIDSGFEQILSQYDSSSGTYPSVCQPITCATELPTTVVTTAVTTAIVKHLLS